MKIIPMRDLKNTAEVERLCAEETGPIYVTKNGRGRLVIMDIEYYEWNMQKISETMVVMNGLEDVITGRTTDGEGAIDDMRSRYGL